MHGMGYRSWRDPSASAWRLEGDEVLLRHRIPTERRGGYEHMIGQIAGWRTSAPSGWSASRHPRYGAMPGRGIPRPGWMKNQKHHRA